jgi:peptidoglycan hydrolase CwlO-like protein
MSAKVRRHNRLLSAAALGVSLAAGLCVADTATGANVTQLKSQLGSAQSQLGAEQQHQKTLAGSISALNGQVSSLSSQISLVQQREAAAQGQLDQYDDALAQARAQLGAEHHKLNVARRRLHIAQKILSAELLNQYEAPQQSFMSIVMSSSGFGQLLSQLEYLDSAKKQEQGIIQLTRFERTQALTATQRITKLAATDQQEADYAGTQTHALVGMGALLASRQAALADERSAQNVALAASQEKGAQLQSSISQIQAQEAAAIKAAETYKPPPVSTVTTTGTSTGTTGGTTTTPVSTAPTNGGGGTGLGPTDGWAIPYSIVLCESGGQNLPPNSAGASGYYQIIPDTWKDFGGSGPAAYLASKSEQDAVASKIWNGGAGASNWSCAAIVGIT